MSNPRKATVSFRKTNGTGINLTPFVRSFSYVDVASGASDSCSVGLHNIDGRFLNDYLPHKGDKYAASITISDWEREDEQNSVNCGTFVLDDFSFSGRPLEASLNAISAPSTSSFMTKKRTQTWSSVTIEQIARVIANRYKLELYYDAQSIKIKSLEQKGETDSSFLNDLCDTYGISMKIFYSRLVIYSRAKYEQKEPVLTIAEKDMKWNLNSTIEGVYTGAKYSYTDPSTNESYEVTVGTGSRWLTCSGEASSEQDAKLRACAAVNKSNEGAITLSFKIPANKRIIATAVIRVKGLGKFDGKYFITKVSHSIGSGYEMSVEAYKLFQRLGGKS